MPKKRKAAAEHAPATALQTGVSFVRVITRLVNYQLLPAPPGSVSPLPPNEQSKVGLQLTVTIVRSAEAPEGVADVVLDATITPDPANQPYKVHVVLSGLFKAPSDASDEAFDSFCKRAAPVIMWPYLRALLSSVTADAPFGPIRMDPVNLTTLLGTGGWSSPVVTGPSSDPPQDD